jgi:hypothetical protein
MIFGFNTDVKYGDTVYHVQSEARRTEQLLQTQVFVRGRCIGKKATSYSERIHDPAFSDDHMHEMLKVQHRAVLEAVRDGSVDTVLRPPSPPVAPLTPPVEASAPVPVALLPEPPAAAAPEPAPEAVPVAAPALAAPLRDGFAIQWTNSDTFYSDSSILMRFVVTDAGAVVADARLVSKLVVLNEAPIYAQATTDQNGAAEMRIILDESSLGDAVVLVQATHGSRTATHKFRLKPNR